MATATPRLIDRGDLLDALNRTASTKVTIVSAPAGSGKTSLLRAWADRPGQPHRLAVMQVQRDQQDAQQFWLALLDALRRASDPTSRAEPPTATPGFNGRAMVDRVLSELTDARHGITLVIDDLHELHSPEALAQLTRLLTKLPPNAHAILLFFYQFLIQVGLFFAIPLYLSVALGLSVIETGIRILPLSLTVLLAAAGIPRFFPNVSPRLVVRFGLLALLAGIVALFTSIDPSAGAEMVTVPLLLAGLGIGALASQLGAVTVSAVPDEQSPEVGGLQNTGTNLGASIGTALAGSILIAALTASFLQGIEQNPAVPASVKTQANVKLAGGVPFISDADLQAALDKAGVGEGSLQGDPRRQPAGTARWSSRCAGRARRDRVARALLRAAHPDTAAGLGPQVAFGLEGGTRLSGSRGSGTVWRPGHVSFAEQAVNRMALS